MNTIQVLGFSSGYDEVSEKHITMAGGSLPFFLSGTHRHTQIHTDIRTDMPERRHTHTSQTGCVKNKQVKISVLTLVSVVFL